MVKIECIIVDWVTGSIRITPKGSKIAEHHESLLEKLNLKRNEQTESNVAQADCQAQPICEEGERLKQILGDFEYLEQEIGIEQASNYPGIERNQDVELEAQDSNLQGFSSSYQAWIRSKENTNLDSEAAPKLGEETFRAPGATAQEIPIHDTTPVIEFQSLYQSTYPFPGLSSAPNFTPVKLESHDFSSLKVLLLIDTRERKRFKGTQHGRPQIRSKSPFQGSQHYRAKSPAASAEMDSWQTNINIQKNLTAFGIEAETSMLSVGDFLWVVEVNKHAGSGQSTYQTKRLVLPFLAERKTISDLLSSIMDGRYVEQMGRLKMSGIQRVFYIIEGDTDKLKLVDRKTVASAITRLRVQYHFVVIRTKDLGDTLQWLRSLHTQVLYHVKPVLPSAESADGTAGHTMLCHSEFGEFQTKMKKGDNLTVGQIWSAMLRSFPGVGRETSAKLRAMFPTPASLLRNGGGARFCPQSLGDGFAAWASAEVRDNLQRALWG